MWENVKAFPVVAGLMIRLNLLLFKKHKNIKGINHFSADYNHHIVFEMLLFCSVLNFCKPSKTKLGISFYYLQSMVLMCSFVSAKVKTTWLLCFVILHVSKEYGFLLWLFIYGGKQNFWNNALIFLLCLGLNECIFT